MGRRKATQSKYERRVTLALKWFHLDNLSYPEIQERFEEEGYGSYTKETIQKYLNQAEAAEEVMEQIQEEHANTRLQVADRQERLFQRAREAEQEATDTEPIMGLVPMTDSVDGRLSSPKEIPYSWEEVQPGEELPDSAPPGADPERDTIIRIDDMGFTTVRPGRQYPIRDYLGQPRYEQAPVGIRHDEPDRTQRSFLRQEQQAHLEAKGKAMGIYEETINISGDLGLEAEVTVPPELVEAVVGASHDRLRSDSAQGDDS